MAGTISMCVQSWRDDGRIHMPIQYEIDEDRGVVRTTASGRLTDEELLEHKRALLDDPRFRPGMAELSDVRGVDELAVTPAGIAEAAQFDESHSDHFGSHRLALLVPTDLVFGMGRMYEQRTDGNTGGVQIFRDEAEALRWLESSG